MADGAVRHATMTVDEYLRMERDASTKHEYVAGTIYALAGVSKRHNRIALNMASLLSDSVEPPCVVYMSDVKVRIDDDAVYYPDVMVACEGEGDDPYVEEAPTLIVEVTSPSTETIDRREKLAAYKRLASLETYLVVEQERRRVQRFWREDGVWYDADQLGSGRIPILRPEVTLTFDQIYAGTGLPAP